MEHSEDVLMATVIFRWFNLIRTGIILGVNNLYRNWDSGLAKKVLANEDQWVTGSFIVKTPDGMNKLEGVCWCIDNVWKVRKKLYQQLMNTSQLAVAHNILMQFPYCGPFMAYEFLTDLRHTHILNHSTDIYAWANPGPGAMRGINRIVGAPLKIKLPLRDYHKYMQQLLEDSKHFLGSHISQPLEMRDIEHSLCEFDKYERVRLGEGKPRNLYRGV